VTAPGLTRSESVESGVRYWILQGPGGAVTFGQREDGTCAHVGIHSTAPMWDFQDRCACEHISGGCYLDMHGGSGQKIGAAWEASDRDDETIWSELEGWYNLLLRDNPRRMTSTGGAR
jgi:hypothetical protein